MKEISKVIEPLRSVGAARVDGILPELWKDGRPALRSKLHELLVCCWEQGKLPSDFCDAAIVTLYKNKGEKSDYSNYRGITLFSIVGKILVRLLLNRLIPTIAEDHLPETQCGFKANRGTRDMVFVLRQLQEKCREQNKGLYVAFVDLIKPLTQWAERDCRWSWSVLAAPKSSSAWLSISKNTSAAKLGWTDLCRPFPIVNGMKQCCVLAPTLFRIFVNMMLKQTIEDLTDDGAIYIRYSVDLRRLHDHTKTLEQLFCNLLFADDAAVVAHTERAPQFLTFCFAEAAALWTRGHLEEAYTPRRVLPSPNHYRWNWAESSLPVHLPGVYHHIKRQDRQRSWQPTGQGKQRFW